MSILAEAVIGFALGYIFAQLLPSIWLFFVVTWEFTSSFLRLGITLCELLATCYNTLKSRFMQNLKANDKITTKEKIELAIGSVGLSYTVLLIVIAIFTNLPNDLIVISWFALTTTTSCIGNRYLKQLST